MSKKFLSLISVLFLVSVLAVSCSNKDKTGDGGTTQTPQGIAKYAGTWDFKEDSSTGNGSGTITIKEDGSVTFEIKQKPYTSKNVVNKGSETYEAKFVDEDPNGETLTLILILAFNNDNKTGSYNINDGSPHTGTITKQ